MRLIPLVLGGLALLAPAPFASAEDVHPLFDKGKRTYKDFCSHCHGIDMKNPGTGSFDLRKWKPEWKDRFWSSVISGRGDMPAWGDILLPDEMDALWVYVMTKGGKEPFPDEAAAASPPLDPPELVASGTLSVCLARNGGAMSGWRHEGGSGFDYGMAKAVADRMGLSLDVTWFESEQDEESDPVREAYAMLALELCDLAPAHPLYENAVGTPPAESAAPPRWDEKPDNWGYRFVTLEPVAVSSPYMRAEIGMVVGPKVDPASIREIGDIEGLRLGIQQGTLSGAIAQHQAPKASVDAMQTFNPGPKFLWTMEGGAFDVAVVDVAAFDFHVRQNPITTLRLLDWRHPMGFNIGMAMLERKGALKANVDRALEDALADGVAAALSKDENVHYAPPREPWMQGRLRRRDLMATH